MKLLRVDETIFEQKTMQFFVVNDKNDYKFSLIVDVKYYFGDLFFISKANYYTYYKLSTVYVFQ